MCYLGAWIFCCIQAKVFCPRMQRIIKNEYTKLGSMPLPLECAPNFFSFNLLVQILDIFLERQALACVLIKWSLPDWIFDVQTEVSHRQEAKVRVWLFARLVSLKVRQSDARCARYRGWWLNTATQRQSWRELGPSRWTVWLSPCLDAEQCHAGVVAVPFPPGWFHTQPPSAGCHHWFSPSPSLCPR